MVFFRNLLVNHRDCIVRRTLSTPPLNPDDFRDLLIALVDAGADVNLADGGGSTPLQLARARGYQEMVDILLAAGAK